MPLSENFTEQEFVPKSVFDVYEKQSSWFINPRCVRVAEFYRARLLKYYQAKFGKNADGSEKVSRVIIVINDWHRGGTRHFRGFRPRSCTEGAELSQHRLGNAFDCDIIIVFSDGKHIEADYNEIRKVILDNEQEFLAAGVCAIEDVAFAPTWLHTDCRWIQGQTKILVVKP